MSDQPNVVVFFTDQQRWDTTGAHGNPMGLTPNYDRMAAEGTHAAYAFTNQPLCLPARSVLQTGRYSTQAGCPTNGAALPVGTRTLAHHFNEAGYVTGYLGKWHLCQCRTEPVPRELRGGYQEWLAANVPEMTSDAYRATLYDENDREVLLPGYRVDALTDAAIRFLDRHQEEPFFLFCSFLEPHHQNPRDIFAAPVGYAERYLDPWMPPDLRALGDRWPARDLPGYYGIVKRLDEALGRVQDALLSLGLAENTILIFSSDHGNHFRTRNAEFKRSCHEASTRIPLALTGPGFVGGGQLPDLVSLIDLPPTLLDACGLPVPGDMLGRSLLSLTRGEREGWPEEVFIQISEAQVARAVRTHRWKYGVNAPREHADWDQASSPVYEEEFLYDVIDDPYELTNLIQEESHRQVAEIMRGRLLRRMAEAEEPEPKIVEAQTRPSG